MQYHTMPAKFSVLAWSFVVILLLVFLAALPSQATGRTAPIKTLRYIPNLQDIQQITAGGYHSCALQGDGGVQCWGGGYWGQLGNGNRADQLTPVTVSGLNGVVSTIAAGLLHSCALTVQGGVQCWGRNGDGQLGDSSVADRATPVNVTSLNSGVTAIATGGFHTCALTTSGGVRCWGYNGEGQLGDSTFTNRPAPVNVSGLTSGVIAIAAGQRHTCALLNNGSVKCWGANSQQQLGNGLTVNSNVPVDATVLGAVQANAITTGDSHTCILTTAGNVSCWGNNSNGQLGDSVPLSQDATQRIKAQAEIAQAKLAPKQPTRAAHAAVRGVTQAAAGMTAVASGSFHTCALTSAGGVQCWGGNFAGQLGNDSTTSQATPADVLGLSSGIRAIAAGGFHTCALTSAGNVLCWGLNASGQVGDSSAPDDRLPVTAVGLTNINLMITGDAHTCVLIGSPSTNVKCMGWNQYGQLGDNTVLNRQTAVDIINLTSPLTSLAGGGAHTCGVTSSGTVKCWGANGSGQLGDQSTTARLTPVDVATLSDVTAVATGDFHTCALQSNGRVKCWGNNGGGQLGDGTTTNRLTPVEVSGLSNVKALTVGQYHSCALTTSGSAHCWGWNGSGQLGDGTKDTRTTPVTVNGLNSGVSYLAAANYHTCAILTNGSARCWGWNSSGQLGDNSTTDRTTPTDVNRLSSGVKSIALGDEHTCALLETNRVQCWGNNRDGQLGNGSNTDTYTPVEVASLNEDIAAVALGGYFTCVRTAAGSVKCWGGNGNGQLGDGNAWRLTPVTVAEETAPQPTVTPTVIPTPPTGESGAMLFMPLVLSNPPLQQPSWQRVGEASLSVSAVAIHNDRLFIGERKEGGRPGGLYQRPLNSCQTAPTFTQVNTIHNSSVLGLAFQDTLGVAATYDVNLFYSLNNGSSWNQSNSNVVRPRTVAIAGGSVFYAGTEDSGIYESVDGGVVWRQIENQPPAINQVAFNTGTLWIGAETGVFKRTLGGLTTVTGGLTSNPSRQVWDFAFRAANEIYIATFDGIYRGDGANSWQAFGLQGQSVYSVEFNNNVLYAGVQNGGVWQRAQNSNDWTPLTSSQWSATATVRALLYDTTSCKGLLAATADGLWLYR